MDRVFKTEFVDEELDDTLEIINQLPKDFVGAFNKVFELLGWKSNRAVANASTLSDVMIGNYLSGTNKPTKESILAICGGMCVHRRITDYLLGCLGIDLRRVCEKYDMFLIFLIETCYHEGLESWNRRIQEIDEFKGHHIS